jgi:uncharacterized phage infection (PIP) family protein YhgE
MTTFHRRFGSISVAAAIALFVASCGESTVSQCNRLAEVVNKAQGFMPAFESDIQTFSTNADQVKSLDDIKDAADQYVQAVNKVIDNLDGLAVELQGTELSDEQLITYRDRYTEMVEGFSEALNRASDAMSLVQDVEAEADLPAKIEESQQQTVQAVQLIQDLSVQESSIINEVNTYCGASEDGPVTEDPEATEEGIDIPEPEPSAPADSATPEGE